MPWAEPVVSPGCCSPAGQEHWRRLRAADLQQGTERARQNVGVRADSLAYSRSLFVHASAATGARWLARKLHLVLSTAELGAQLAAGVDAGCEQLRVWGWETCRVGAWSGFTSCESFSIKFSIKSY